MSKMKDMDFLYKIGRNIRDIRISKGIMTQRELADLSGLTQSAIGNYEAGTRNIDLKTLLTISDCLKVTIDDLVRGSFDNILFNSIEEISVLACIKKYIIQNLPDNFSFDENRYYKDKEYAWFTSWEENESGEKYREEMFYLEKQKIIDIVEETKAEYERVLTNKLSEYTSTSRWRQKEEEDWHMVSSDEWLFIEGMAEMLDVDIKEYTIEIKKYYGEKYEDRKVGEALAVYYFTGLKDIKVQAERASFNEKNFYEKWHLFEEKYGSFSDFSGSVDSDVVFDIFRDGFVIKKRFKSIERYYAREHCYIDYNKFINKFSDSEQLEILTELANANGDLDIIPLDIYSNEIRKNFVLAHMVD